MGLKTCIFKDCSLTEKHFFGFGSVEALFPRKKNIKNIYQKTLMVWFAIINDSPYAMSSFGTRFLFWVTQLATCGLLLH